MHQFIESIRIENGKAHHLALHTERLNRTRQAHFGSCEVINLKEYLHEKWQDFVLKNTSENLYKCRIIYSKEIEQISFHPYQIRPVHSLKLVEDNAIDYTYKTADRAALHALFKQKAKYDDIIIVKNGLLTDSYYANLIFEVKGQYFTPRRPLLKGIRRAQLLRESRVKAIDIQVTDLKKFEAVHLVNAMMGVNDCRLDCSEIFGGGRI
ncbi:MAG: aminotransferase class IV [Bacteroidota bacterium]